MSADSFFMPCEQPIYEDVEVSADGRVVGAVSERCRYIDVSSPDFLRRVLSEFVKVQTSEDVLKFCRNFGFPLPPRRDVDWHNEWLPCVSVRTVFDLAASYRLLFELIEGLIDNELLLFENLLALEAPANLDDHYMHFFADYTSLELSQIQKGRALAKEMSNGYLPRNDQRVVLIFYPRNYPYRWTGRIRGRNVGVVDSDWHRDTGNAQFGHYEIPPGLDLPITAVRKAASLVVKNVLNMMLDKIHPYTEYESNQLKTYFRLPSMEYGMIWVLYSLLTGAVFLARCPHPSCGALYSKKGKQGCCGSERCQKWVSRQKKKKIGGVK